jgi:hypothetical protein
VGVSPIHSEVARRLGALREPRSRDLDTLLRYYVGAEKAFDAAGEALVRHLARSDS